MSWAWLSRKDWAKRWPSIESAPGPIHTLSIPWPIGYKRPTVADPWVFSALVVALPWYPCRCLDEMGTD